MTPVARAAHKLTLALDMRDDADRLVTLARNELRWVLEGNDADPDEHVMPSREAAQYLVSSLDEYRTAMGPDEEPAE